MKMSAGSSRRQMGAVAALSLLVACSAAWAEADPLQGVVAAYRMGAYGKAATLIQGLPAVLPGPEGARRSLYLGLLAMQRGAHREAAFRLLKVEREKLTPREIALARNALFTLNQRLPGGLASLKGPRVGKTAGFLAQGQAADPSEPARKRQARLALYQGLLAVRQGNDQAAAKHLQAIDRRHLSPRQARQARLAWQTIEKRAPAAQASRRQAARQALQEALRAMNRGADLEAAKHLQGADLSQLSPQEVALVQKVRQRMETRAAARDTAKTLAGAGQAQAPRFKGVARAYASADVLNGLATKTLDNALTLEPERSSDNRLSMRGQLGMVRQVNGSNQLFYHLDLTRLMYDDLTDLDYGEVRLGGEWRTRLSPAVMGRLDLSLSQSLISADQAEYARDVRVDGSIAHQDLSGILPKGTGGRLDGTLSYVDFQDTNAPDGYRFRLSPVLTYSPESIKGLHLELPLTVGADNAKQKSFAYDQYGAGLAASWEWPEVGFFNAFAHYERLDFEGNDTVQAGRRREDDVLRLGVGYSRPLGLGVHAFARGMLTENDSNIARMDYRSSLFSVGLSADY